MIDSIETTLSRPALGLAVLLLGLGALRASGEAGAAARAAEPVSWAQVEAWVWEDAATYGVSGRWLLWVAGCETGFSGNPYLVGRLGEVGPFQWHPRGLWWSTPAGRAGVSPWDIRENVRMASWAFANGLSRHWTCA
jgi:hypothetical protein